MSTYYLAVCDEHRVVSRVLGGRSFPGRWWRNDNGELEQFLREHGDCDPPPQIISEHDDRNVDYAEMPEEAREA